MISRLKIEGFKSIKSQDIELNSINILIGGNGVGKSNFISAFSLIKNIYEGSLQRYILKKGGADTFLHFGRKKTNEIRLQLEFDTGDNKNRFLVNLEPSQESLFISSLSTAFLSYGNWHPKKFEENVNESNFRNIQRGQAWYVTERLWEIEVYHFHDTGDDSPLKGFCSLHDNEKLRKFGSNLPAFLYLLQEKHSKHFQRIEETIKSIAPFFKEFVLSPNRLSSGDENIQLQWIENDNEDAIFNAYQLSDGTLRFIALVTLLLQPHPPKTIIIDEPELGLHPVAINKLASLIKKASKKSQIIISSQSVNLVDNFDPENIITADRINNETVFSHLNPDILDAWLNDYSLGEVWEKKIIGGQPFTIKK